MPLHSQWAYNTLCNNSQFYDCLELGFGIVDCTPLNTCITTKHLLELQPPEYCINHVQYQMLQLSINCVYILVMYCIYCIYIHLQLHGVRLSYMQPTHLKGSQSPPEHIHAALLSAELSRMEPSPPSVQAFLGCAKMPLYQVYTDEKRE